MNLSIKHILFLSLVCLTTLHTQSQEPNYYSFNELYGFEIKTIYQVEQDRSGIFWLATNEGLVRFDGVDFKKYRNVKYDKEASNLTIDQYNRVWFSNFGGQLFYCQNDSVHTVIPGGDEVGFIKEYEIISENEVAYIHQKGNTLRRYNLKSHKDEVVYQTKGDDLTVFLDFKDHHFILFIKETLEKGKINQEAFTQLQISSAGMEVEQKSQIIVPKQSARIQLFNWEDQYGLYVGMPNSTKIYRFPDSGIMGDSCAQLLSTNGGMLNHAQGVQHKLFLHSKEGTFKIEEGYRLKHLLNDYSVSHLFKDREGNWWVCTLNAGILIIPNWNLNHLDLTNSQVTASVFDRDGNLFYVDFIGDFYRCNPPYVNPKKIGAGFKGITRLFYKPHKRIIEFSNYDKVYVLEDNAFHKRPDAFYVKDRINLSPNLQLIGVESGAFIESPRGDSNDLQEVSDYVKLDAENEKPKGNIQAVRRQRVDQLSKDRKGDYVYIDFIDGVGCLSKTQPFRMMEYNGQPIFSRLLEPGELQGMWIFSEEGSVLKFEGEQLVFELKVDYTVTAIHECDKFLFLGSKQGVHRINLDTRQEFLIGKTNGLIQEQISRLFVQQNTLHILGENYLQKVPYTYQFKNVNPPILQISDIQLFEQSVEPVEHFFFHPEENDLTFHFKANAMRSQQSYTYHYRLVGASEAWNITDAQRPFARFYQLAPGNYTFEVKAENEDHLASETKRIKFTIDNPFTQKWWFYVLLVIVAGLVVIVFYRRRTNIIRRESEYLAEQNNLKKELYKSKISAIRAQMNPHFMFNALNTIQEFIVTNQSEIAAEYLADFADLMRMYLDQSKHEKVTLREELDAMEIYLRLEDLRFDNELNYEIKSNQVPLDEIKIPVMLLQPFVENAIKHGLLHKKGKKRIEIIVEEGANSSVVISIQDNGIGRVASQAINKKKTGSHQSFATSAIQQRIELINQSQEKQVQIEYEDLMDTSKSSIGTRVVVLIK